MDIVFWLIKKFLLLEDTVENSLHLSRSFDDKGISGYAFNIKERVRKSVSEVHLMLQSSHSLKCIEEQWTVKWWVEVKSENTVKIFFFKMFYILHLIPCVLNIKWILFLK